MVSSPQRFLIHWRDVGGDPLPARIGEADPGLALAADQIVAADLEFEIDGGDVAAERQDFQPNAPFLDAGTGRPRHAVGMDLLEAIAVLVQAVADPLRPLPEGVAEPPAP